MGRGDAESKISAGASNHRIYTSLFIFPLLLSKPTDQVEGGKQGLR